MQSEKRTNSDNYLEYIPVPSADLNFEIKDGKVTIFRENTGAFNWVAQKLFKKPRVTQIHLDEMGNFVWPLMDGKNDIYVIAARIKEEFGDKAEPLYERAVSYFRTLVDYGFVQYINKK